MTVTLSQVYGQRPASNPNARNWLTPLTLPKSFGNRKARRRAVAILRTTKGLK